MNRNTQTDNQLVERYLSTGDEQVLELLVGRWSSRVYQFIRRYIGDQATAEDLTQETFVKMWRGLHTFRQSANFGTWLFVVAKNTAIDYLRKGSHEVVFSDICTADGSPVSFEEIVPDPTPSVHESAVANELARDFTSALTKLSPKIAMVLRLRVSDDLTTREIAARANMPEGTVKSRLHHGTAALRRILRR